MPRRKPGPFRVLLASARPLVLKVERWQAELNTQAAVSHEAALRAALEDMVDVGRVWSEGDVLHFEVFRPRPARRVVRDRLAKVLPLAGLTIDELEVRALDVHRPGEEVRGIREALSAIANVQVLVDPAATPHEIQAVLRREHIDLFVFVGHGDELGGLYFEDGRGCARRLGPGELGRLLEGRAGIVFVGSCHSARALEWFDPEGAMGRLAVIGLDGEHPIPRRAVQLFLQVFIEELGRGASVGQSFQNAVAGVREDDLVGQRLLPDGADDGLPSPWRRFQLRGNKRRRWNVEGRQPSTIQELVTRSPHVRLPRTDDLFVGRNQEIAATMEALDRPRQGIGEHKPRIVTLYGGGGIGKTRLAGAVAEWLAERGKFPGGIYEVDCQAVFTATDVALAMLRSMGHSRADGLADPVAELTRVLSRSDLPRLFVLDNLEGAFADSGEADEGAPSGVDGLHPGLLLKACLAAAPDLRILVTCRWPLNIGADEAAFEVEPLSHEQAAQLFVLSVHDRDVREGLSALPAERRMAVLAPILLATECVPLALVLAARRLSDPGADLVALIRRASENVLAVCEDPSLQHLPPRLRSVRASLQLSYARLSPHAQELFARLGFFPGGVARYQDGLAHLLGENWRALLAEVAQSGLARYDRELDRYSLLQPVLAFARETLDAGEGDSFRARAARWWAAFTSAFVPLLAPTELSTMPVSPSAADGGSNEPHMADGGRMRPVARLALGQESLNLLAVASWAISAADHAAHALWAHLTAYLTVTGEFQSAASLQNIAEAAAVRSGDEWARLTALGNRAAAMLRMGRQAEVLQLLEEVTEGFRALYTAEPETYLRSFVTSLLNLAPACALANDLPAARTYFEQCLQILRQASLPDHWQHLSLLSATLNGLANVVLGLGDHATAHDLYKEALEATQELAVYSPDEFLPDLAALLHNVGAQWAREEEWNNAAQSIEQSVQIRRALAEQYPKAHSRGLARALRSLGYVHTQTKDWQNARLDYEEALAILLPGLERSNGSHLSEAFETVGRLSRVYKELGEVAELKTALALAGLLRNRLEAKDGPAAA